MNFVRDINLTEQIIVLDGLTGTGKTMFSPLINSFERVQNGRFEYMMEYLCIAASNDKMSADAASSLFNLLADIKCYDGSISREVNFRPSDLSSVFKSSKTWAYFRQLFLPDGQAAWERIQRDKPILFFVTHQILSCIEPMHNAFKQRLKVVQMVRHPLYLLDHWESYIMMHGSSPRDFAVWINHGKNVLPWFAHGWENRYIAAHSYDRSAFSISFLFDAVFTYASDPENASFVTFIPFEKFVLVPDEFIEQLENFLGTKATSDTRKVLKSQHVPRPSINAGPQKSIYKRYGLKKYDPTVGHEEDYQSKLAAAKQKTSPGAFAVLMECCANYERIFGRWF